MKLKLLYLLPLALLACGEKAEEKSKDEKSETKNEKVEEKDFVYQTEQFGDLRILRYKSAGFDELTSKQKELLYYLYEAAHSGRDITWDQNCKYNLTVRKTIENIVTTYSGEKSGEKWDQFMVYAKRVWFSNGIHHHYNSDKILPEFNADYLKELISKSTSTGFPLEEGEEILDKNGIHLTVKKLNKETK